MFKKITSFFCFLCLLGSVLSVTIYADGYQRLDGIMHIQSTVSDGLYSIDEIVRRAKRKGISVVCITDHALKRWDYGIPPLRSILKRSIKDRSILIYGAKKYLSEIQEARKKYPGMIIIPGAEVSCFYYWDGSLVMGNLKMRAWHRHLLVVGLERAEMYENLPLIANGKSRYDQYHGDAWYKPYQDLIDYVRQEGGMTFWAHPEAEFVVTTHGVLIHTLPYEKLLPDTEGYSGYSIFHEGYRKIGRLGGIWDQLLREYGEKKRKKPVWAIGEIDYEGRRYDAIDSVKNVFLVREKSKYAVLRALKNGNLYVVTRSRSCELRLDEFNIRDEQSKSKAIAGETLKRNGAVTVTVAISAKEETNKPAKIMVVKNGELFKLYEENLPFSVSFVDEEYGGDVGTAYFRIDAACQGSRLVSNPIFLEHAQ